MKYFAYFAFVSIVFSSFLFASSVSLVGAGDVITFEANVFGPPPAVLSISVQDYIFLGNVTKGQETEKVKVTLNNTGNVAIVATPQLVNSSDAIFSNLYFARRSTDTYKKIGGWSMNISSPDGGGVESDYFYTKLDLRSYEGEISQDLMGLKANVKIFVAQQ